MITRRRVGAVVLFGAGLLAGGPTSWAHPSRELLRLRTEFLAQMEATRALLPQPPPDAAWKAFLDRLSGLEAAAAGLSGEVEAARLRRRFEVWIADLEALRRSNSAGPGREILGAAGRNGRGTAPEFLQGLERIKLSIDGARTPTGLSAYYDGMDRGRGQAVEVSPPAAVAAVPAGPSAPRVEAAKKEVRGAAEVPSLVASPVRTSGPSAFDAHIQAASAEFGVPAEVIRAMIGAKSGFNKNLVSGGAYGLMGVAQSTGRALAKRLGYDPETIDLHDPAVNIRVGTYALAHLLRRFGWPQASDGLHRALAAYQVGPKAVIQSGGIPGDRFVKEFIAAFELSYRGGPGPKPPVAVVKPHRVPVLREGKERLAERVRPSPVQPNGGGVARWFPLIQVMARRYKLDETLSLCRHKLDAVTLIAAKMKVESGGDPNAVGRDGDTGLLQLVPATAKWLGVEDSKDPEQNLNGAVRFFSDLLMKFNDEVLAVAGYNAGPDTIRIAVQQGGGRIPASVRINGRNRSLAGAQNHTRKVFRVYVALGGRGVDVESYLAPAPPGVIAAKN